MKSIDNDVLAGYNTGKEKGRLHNGLGLIEFERTKEILRQQLPPAPAVIYDIGGGYGEYSYYLASLGYEVYLYDIAERNIEMSRDLGRECGLALKATEVADARSIMRPDESANAILLFGPLYHIVNYEERQLCLKECYRLLKHNGLLFTAAITCYATTLKCVRTYDENALLDDIEFYKMLETEVKTGLHTKKPMGLSYFHKPDELKDEIETAGFGDIDIRGVIGPCWLIPNLDDAWKNESKRESIMRIVRLCEKEESLMGLSTHFLSISKKGNYSYTL
ncbi:MAG: methyltransferase domain-containing protein [Bacteroidaceae bacterium]|nr:methyltransferase domain-containing protein [Bacteroidaceae bacterium]